MHFHPDITHQAMRDRYAELLEEARRERLAALEAAQPELQPRFARMRDAMSGMPTLVERRPLTT